MIRCNIEDLLTQMKFTSVILPRVYFEGTDKNERNIRGFVRFYFERVRDLIKFVDQYWILSLQLTGNITPSQNKGNKFCTMGIAAGQRFPRH